MARNPARTALLALPPALLLALGACGTPLAWTPAMGWLAVAEGGSIAVQGRGLGDTVVSLVSGRDCSVVRLAREESYCAPREPPPAPPPFCTRSRGGVDCWEVPPAAWPPLRGLADGRTELTAAQDANRTRRWPGLF